MGDNLYQKLGLKPGASGEKIRKAYKKLARKHHPDVNPGDTEAEERFKEISAAYEVLSDEDKRSAYDEFGEDALRSGFDPEQARAYQTWQSRRAAGGVPFSDQQAGFDLDDLLSHLGGFGGAGRSASSPRGQRSAPTGGDVRAIAELDLAQAVRGAEVTIVVPRRNPCGTCDGSGRDPKADVERCTTCGGSGHRQVAQGPMSFVATCPVCSGSGERSQPCPDCGGRGYEPTKERVRVRIPPGADNGSIVRIAGKGSGTGKRGDLVIETRVRPHPWLRRDGLDLRMTLPVTFNEAYNGAKVDVPTFEGTVSVKIPARSQTRQKLRLRGKGVKRGSKTGDLYVELEVRVPDDEDLALAEALRNSDTAYKRNVRAELQL